MSIDPIRLAQFMVLPGAADLVDAFSAIPPGPIRDSVVHHARVLAEAAGWSAPDFSSLQPVTARVAPPKEPPRLASPFAKDLVATSVEGQIVERALRGEADYVIADDMGVKLGLVVRLKAKARREGGVTFPGDDGAKPKAATKPKTSRKGIKQTFAMPVPPPPYWWEDPQSPVWHNPRLLPALSENSTGTMAGIGPTDTRSFATMLRAAERRGMTLRQYVAQRLEIVRRVDAGEVPMAVADALRLQGAEVYGLMTKVGRGRMETMNARPLPAEPVPEPIQEAEPEPVQAKAGKPHYREASAVAARTAAAAKWGFADMSGYLHARDRVRELRLQGLAPAVIASRMGQPYRFVKNALDYWRDEGVAWPAIDIHQSHRVETAAA
jgi:hypothetical protein